MAPHVRIPRYATQAVNRRLGAAVRHVAAHVSRRRAARHPLGRRLVSRAMAGVALAGGFEAHGGRAYPCGARWRIRLEPHEGQFDLDWLDRAVALAAQHGIWVVLGTPSAAPPAWLTQKYPDTLRTEQDGRKAKHDNRQQGPPTSARYREFCRRIAEQMARRFGRNPNVIGWQIDNEYGAFSWDDETHRQFQDWLRQKYGTLDALNRRWTTEYWSQTYTDWAQIPMGPGGNPGLNLEFKRFQ